MDRFQGVTAEIISNGQVLNFYDDPDLAGNEESYVRDHYVEVIAGSIFQVKVNLTPQFHFYKMKPEHAVQMIVRVDGRRDSSLATHCTKKHLQKLFSEGKPGGQTFTGPRQFDKKTGQWMRSDYSFGNLALSMLVLSVSAK